MSDRTLAIGFVLLVALAIGGIGTAVVDRGGHKFHGRGKALADAARQGGLVF